MTRKAIGTLLALAGVATASTGCNTLRLEVVDEPVGQTIVERHNYWLWGGFPSDVTVDVREKCPQGVTAIEESIRPTDALMTLASLTIWSPRTATYHCRSGRSF